MKKIFSILLILILVLSQCASAYAEITKEEIDEQYEKGCEKKAEGLFDLAAMYFKNAADKYEQLGLYAEARNAYVEAKYCYENINETYWADQMQYHIDLIDKYHSIGTIISEGNLAIVTALSGMIVGLIGGYFLFGRKKKKAGAETK